MGQTFVLDSDGAQQVGERLTSIGQAIESIPPGPSLRVAIGTGVVEGALSELERGVATARQNLAGSVAKTASGFAAVVKGAADIDQRKAQEAGTI
jgi:hypothetical protein